eukprot:scaffold73416_cov57-Phaeocystis_antarctica.AAC.5
MSPVERRERDFALAAATSSDWPSPPPSSEKAAPAFSPTAWNMRVGIFSTSRPVARGGVTATATMSEVSLIGEPICSRSTLVSVWQRKIATGHAPTLLRKVSVPFCP